MIDRPHNLNKECKNDVDARLFITNPACYLAWHIA